MLKRLNDILTAVTGVLALPLLLAGAATMLWYQFTR